MRISDGDREKIRQATRQIAGAAAKPMLFGSRVNDRQKGGDIDLLIELPEPARDRLKLSLQIAAAIQRRVGLRKIDVLVADAATPETPLLRQARREAVEL
jgi:predicted nucleotidyltransferase